MSVALFVSSAGDTNLAKATVKQLLESNPDETVVMIPLTAVAQEYLQSELPEGLEINESFLEAGESGFVNSKLQAIIKNYNISHAYIGVSSDPNAELPFELAKQIEVPVTIAYEYMFHCPEHAFWQHIESLAGKDNLAIAVPLKLAKNKLQAIAPEAKVEVVGQLSISQAEAKKNDTAWQVHNELGTGYTFISGTSCKDDTDKHFLEALLKELATGNHENMKVRFGIHPGVNDKASYVAELLNTCEQYTHEAIDFKIIMSHKLFSALPEALQNRVEKSKFINLSNLDGNAIANAASRVGQALPGALTNEAAIRGKPSYYHVTSIETYLPHTIFSKDIKSFLADTKQPTPLSAGQLGLEGEQDVAEKMTTVLLRQKALYDLKKYRLNVNNLIETKYPHIAALTQAQRNVMIEQLAWVQENVEYTPQADVEYKNNQNNAKWTNHLHREVIRALSRIENMLMLRTVNNGNFEFCYEKFTQDQPENDKLSRKSFQALADQFLNLNDDEVEAQTIASLIASVTLSPKAQDLATEKLGEHNWPYDSVMFSGRTINQAGEIYPMFATASESIQDKVRACFPDDNRHWRHAFYLENVACLDELANEISSYSNAKKEEMSAKLQTWLVYWLTNALGFNGHTKSMVGSSFITESVFQRATMLNNAIATLLENPIENDAFGSYCQACVKKLALNVENRDIQLLIVRILIMTNQFTPETAKQLQQHIRENQLSELAVKHSRVFKQGRSATYLPAFLDNVSTASLETDRLANLTNAIDWLSSMIERSNNQIVSFRKMDANAVKWLMYNNFDSSITYINNKGEVETNINARQSNTISSKKPSSTKS